MILVKVKVYTNMSYSLIQLLCRWKWTDCSPWNATFWARGEPNNAGGAEHCLQYVFKHPSVSHLNHKWNDLACRHEIGFLCSKSICSGDNGNGDGKSVSEPTGSAVTGESVVWRSASVSLAATLLLLLIFF